MSKTKIQKRTGKLPGAITTASQRPAILGAATPQSAVALPDDRPGFTPKRLAGVLDWHEESVRRKLRNREWASHIVGRRRIVPAWEVDRIMRESFVARAA